MYFNQRTATLNSLIPKTKPVERKPISIANTYSGGGGGYVAPYTGQLSTRTYVPATFSAANKQLMSRNGHIARTDMTQFQIEIPNWYAGSGTETVMGADATVTAAIEYPAGVYKQVLFSGSATGTITNGTTLRSDFINLAIPNGQKFFTRIFFQNTAGVAYHGTNVAAAGEGANIAVSGLSDLTMGGVIAPSVVGFGPIAIIGQISTPSIALIGDSRAFGQGDTALTGNLDMGELARSIGGTLPYQNLSVPGDAIQFYLVNSTRRRASLYCSHAILQMSINDLRSSRTQAQVSADLTTAKNLLPLPIRNRVWLSTTAPQTSSTDTWATDVNQTPSLPTGTGANEPQRVLLNNWKRSTPTGFAGYFEVADCVEAVRDGGKWIVNGTANYATADGLHETSAAYALIAASGNINPTVFKMT